MISFWCSSKNVTLCSISRANLSVFSSLRVILATKTSGVFWNLYGTTSRLWPPDARYVWQRSSERSPMLGLAGDKVGDEVAVEFFDNIRIEIRGGRPFPARAQHGG